MMSDINRLLRIRWIIGGSVIAAIAVLDQVTKWMITTQFKLYETVVVIPGFFNITYIKNKGAVFGIFRNAGPSFRFWFFCVATILLVAVLFFVMIRSARDQKWTFYALSLILGGAIGNLIDRFRFGEVTDFVDVLIGTYHWPAFNVADAAITCGAVVMIIQLLFTKEGRVPSG